MHAHCELVNMSKEHLVNRTKEEAIAQGVLGAVWEPNAGEGLTQCFANAQASRLTVGKHAEKGICASLTLNV